MTKAFSRRFIIAAGLGGLATAAGAGAPAVSLRPRLRPAGFAVNSGPSAARIVAGSNLSGRIAFAVADTGTGEILESRGAATTLPPASVTKAVTALYALDVLGPEFRFETRLVATGPLKDGRIEGDLVLAGGGDPTLDTNALADMASRLKAAGVREITGNFRVWGGALPFSRAIDTSQPEHVGYNPALSGLSLNYNRVYFEWKRGSGGYSVSMDARSSRYRPEVQVARMKVSDRRSPVYSYFDKGDHDSWTVARGALGNGGARWLPVRKPAAYAGEVFATFARSHGIELGKAKTAGKAPAGKALVVHRSDPLRRILRGMLKYSNNMTAELVGMAATAARQGRPGSLRASARAMSRWSGEALGLGSAQLVDHSGLGDASRLNSAEIARMLVRVHADNRLEPLLKPIPLRDENGRIDKGHPVKVAAKTGTLYFVSALAGYATVPGGRQLAFAILTADTDRRARINRAIQERPPGARSWNIRSKRLQQALIERWSTVYGS
ncbi:D-alanyl-D-alanine carboxypeptidase/D-alanyl-D-alanine-endopeptidase [Roseovarius sp. TE539]|uniref:D-alanyl-D-alanine carboxypeptidase/D-alanyl-D-alanine endopeptidase n=1 Tax=Roseovarius sp. TE539 TaxID=2249812 RepID=UPI000DDCF839|nr:D-alanyl-D-alanine carboxypeptidase/D-alanyl-D-alanine-endopeptidase [Roseovarius sp. TE539]RBI70360.1 D-alanyl-D-alanine carboxypeptidase/D-alanyl-D-alanine-endopeptidase [Roseovarius sp. TE539]